MALDVRDRLWGAALSMIAAMASGNALAGDVPEPPAQAVAAGYTIHSFGTRRFDTAVVDVAGTYKTGFQWYLTNYFGSTTPVSAALIHPDGVLTTLNSNDISNDSIASIAGSRVPPYYVGTAFGCGAYVTADISFDAAAVDNHHGFPSWWTMSAEHLLNMPGQHWPGQEADFQHFGEVDIFEFNRDQSEHPFSYGASLHEWFGIYNKTCGADAGFCSVNTGFSAGTVSVPPMTEFAEFHSVGMLWTRSSATEDGSVSFFFDNEKVGQSVSWSSIANTTLPPPPLDPWKFGVLDSQHLALIFGSGSGSLNIRSVDVWQGPTACNLVH